MLFNAVQMAGRNSNMLRVVLELIGEVKQAQTNVTVTNNVNPYAGLTEDELRKLAKGECFTNFVCWFYAKSAKNYGKTLFDCVYYAKWTEN
jgi:hypothetical protein